MRPDWLLAAAFLGVVVTGCQTKVGDQPLHESSKLLFHEPIPGVTGKALTAVVVDLPPGANAAPHRHGDAFVYACVVEGAVTSQLRGEPARTFNAGDSWSEPPGADHIVTQNVSKRHAARLLVVFVANEGAALKTLDGE